MASMVAQLYQGPVDRRIGVDGIEGAARAFEGLGPERIPVNALAMQGVLPHDIDGVIQEGRRVRRDLGRTVRRARGRLLASQAQGRAEEEQRACDYANLVLHGRARLAFCPALFDRTKVAD